MDPFQRDALLERGRIIAADRPAFGARAAA